MRIEGGNNPKTAEKTAKTKDKNAGLEEQMKDYPRAPSLIQALRDPEMRKKLEEKIGEELVGKLDKIFNAQPPGVPPVQQAPAPVEK